jgi:NSS family neurotransmitter:Na+ symporter
MEREHLGSRLGFILLSAGCAIGIGNVWKFPWLAGQYGGSAFVLVYLVCLIVLGIPAMSMEFAMGRAAQTSPVKMYYKLEPKNSKWHLHGYVCLAGNYLLMMYYTTVAGWMILYFAKTASGAFDGLDAQGVSEQFSRMLSSPQQLVTAMIIIVVLGFSIIALGLQNGLERVTKVMMLALLAIMLVLAIHSAALPGGKEGLSFYLLPNWKTMKEAGVWSTITAAMNQAFFTLSIGIGAMAIFGSYIGKDRSLYGESVNVAILDTFVAFTAGLIIFPACFAYGVEPGAGPSLIFITLPNIFNHMAAGRVWGSLFFVFMTFAAFSTVLAVFENIMAMTMDLHHISRRKASVLCCILVILLSLPCALGYNVLSGVHPFGKETFLDLEDFLVSNLILPIGAFIFVLFCTTKAGWGWDAFVAEADTGKGLKVKKWMRPLFTFLMPVLIVIILVAGLI